MLVVELWSYVLSFFLLLYSIEDNDLISFHTTENFASEIYLKYKDLKYIKTFFVKKKSSKLQMFC